MAAAYSFSFQASKYMALPSNDASLIPQPDYSDLWQAYVQGAKDGQEYPDADLRVLNRSADAYCKLVHATKDPEGFKAMGREDA